MYLNESTQLGHCHDYTFLSGSGQEIQEAFKTGRIQAGGRDNRNMGKAIAITAGRQTSMAYNYLTAEGVTTHIQTRILALHPSSSRHRIEEPQLISDAAARQHMFGHVDSRWVTWCVRACDWPLIARHGSVSHRCGYMIIHATCSQIAGVGETPQASLPACPSSNAPAYRAVARI